MAALGADIGVLETMWRDYRRWREKAELEEERQCRRERVDREKERRKTEGRT